jgi:hypothetical protein
MSESESDVRSRVRDVLAAIGVTNLEETPNGYCFRLISSQMCVFAHEHPPGQVFVRLQGYVAGGVPLTPELFEHVAVHGGDWLYGHLNVFPSEDGTGTVVLTHKFAAHHMTGAALDEAVRKLARTLEELDDQITAQFGGHTRYEAI